MGCYLENANARRRRGVGNTLLQKRSKCVLVAQQCPKWYGPSKLTIGKLYSKPLLMLDGYLQTKQNFVNFRWYFVKSITKLVGGGVSNNMFDLPSPLPSISQFWGEGWHFLIHQNNNLIQFELTSSPKYFKTIFNIIAPLMSGHYSKLTMHWVGLLTILSCNTQ